MDERIELIEAATKEILVELLANAHKKHTVELEKRTNILKNLCEAEYYICKSSFYNRK